jgi:hypothetical protein
LTILIFCAAMAGCRSGTLIGSQTQNSGNSSVVLAITDLPPSNVSILSTEVILTGATLNPGNVSIFSGSTTIELTRLQTDIAYLATAANIPAGTYTSVTLTFANPMLTIENDTGSALASCAVGSICMVPPTAIANLSTTVPLTSFAIAANSTTGLLIDVNLENLLSSALAADFKAGTTVSPFTPAGTGAPLVGAEDVVGQAGSISASSNTFTLQNVTGSFPLKVVNTTTFFQFPSSACATPGFSCLQANQILSVDIGIQPDGSLAARNILFEDADNSDAEIEGMITSTNVGLQQFNIVTLAISATGSGLNIGDTTTVQYSVAPQTPFDIDFAHADNAPVSTAGFLFAMPSDLTVGQQVSIRRNAASSASLVKADRVRLRSSRLSATEQSVGSPNIFLYNPPSIFSGHGVTQIEAQTSSPTIFSLNGNAAIFNSIFTGEPLSVRGPLFNVSGQRTLIATKVVLH